MIALKDRTHSLGLHGPAARWNTVTGADRLQ